MAASEELPAPLRATVAELARGDLDTLLAEARAEARAEVKALLREAYARELLAGVREAEAREREEAPARVEEPARAGSREPAASRTPAASQPAASPEPATG